MQDLKNLPPHHPAFEARARQERAAEAARLVAALRAAIIGWVKTAGAAAPKTGVANNC